MAQGCGQKTQNRRQGLSSLLQGSGFLSQGNVAFLCIVPLAKGGKTSP